MMSKRMNVGYIPYGCYIQDTTGKLWKAGTWNGSSTFNGVAVYTEECAFVMRQWAEKKAMMGSSYASVSSSLIEYPTEQEAKTDFDGFGNTDLLASSLSVAKQYVEDNPFPDGDVGYIPSLGELWKAYEYKNEINALFIEATGDVFTDALYGSSTLEDGAGSRGSKAYFWTLDFGTGTVISEQSTSTSTYIRPFKELLIPGVTPKRENKIEIKSQIVENAIGTVVERWIESQYPVASDITVTAKGSTTTYTLTILEGQKKSNHSVTYYTEILSVTPTEDDKFTYVF